MKYSTRAYCSTISGDAYPTYGTSTSYGVGVYPFRGLCTASDKASGACAGTGEQPLSNGGYKANVHPDISQGYADLDSVPALRALLYVNPISKVGHVCATGSVNVNEAKLYFASHTLVFAFWQKGWDVPSLGSSAIATKNPSTHAYSLLNGWTSAMDGLAVDATGYATLNLLGKGSMPFAVAKKHINAGLEIKGKGYDFHGVSAMFLFFPGDVTDYDL